MQLPPEYDTSQSLVEIYLSVRTRRYVKVVVTPTPPNQEYDTEPQARALWQAKYGEQLPPVAGFDEKEDEVRQIIPETTRAYMAYYMDDILLSDAEWNHVRQVATLGDLTLDMLWLIVKGLGWRPLQPVHEDAPEWEVIWSKDDICGGYLDIVRSLLGMEEMEWDKYYAISESRRLKRKRASC